MGPGCRLTASGRLAPARTPVLVDLVYVTPEGRQVRAMTARAGADGVFSVGRAFTGCGKALVWQARSRGDLVTATGVSPLREAALRR